MIVWFFFNSKWCMVRWRPEKKAETSNHCKLLMVLLHDGKLKKIYRIQRLWKSH